MAAEVVEAVVGANVQNHRKKPLSARSFNKKVVVVFRHPSYSMIITSKMMILLRERSALLTVLEQVIGLKFVH